MLTPLSELIGPTEAGGKAWSLSRLRADGLDVPDGVVLPRTAHDAFLAANNLTEAAADPRLSVADPESFIAVSAELRARVLAAGLPEDVAAALSEWWRDGRWIVRSSAVGEDGEADSFAGQLDSIRDVTTLEDLQAAVLSCWASYFSDRALFYQTARGVRLQGMGVVIQRMITPVRGGVLFTRAPDDPDTVLIEWVDGHPAALVDGSVTPHRVVLPRTAPAHPTLGALAMGALALEEARGVAQDIEWVVDAEERLWLVQSRAITTPPPPSEPRRTLVYSNVNVNENYPAPISPLLYSIARESYANYWAGLGRSVGLSESDLDTIADRLDHSVGAHGARLYYNLTNIHESIGIAPGGDKLAAAFDGFVGVDDEGKTGGSTRPRSSGATTLALVRAVVTALASLGGLPHRVPRFEGRVDRYAAATADLTDATLADLRHHLRGFLDIRFRRWTDASLADFSATIGYAAIKAVLRQRLPEEEVATLPQTLLSAIPRVVSAGPVASLWGLSRMVRGNAALQEAVESGDLDAVRAASPVFADALDAHLRDWGFRISGELMLTVPDYTEDPAALLPLIMGYVDVDGPSPEEAAAAQGRRREAVLDGLRGRMDRWHGPLQLAVAAAHQGIRYRERVRLKQALLYSRLRQVVLALEARLIAAGRLKQAGDLFFLTWREIDEWLGGSAMFPDTIGPVIALRRASHARLSQTTPPDTVALPEGAYLTATAAEEPITSQAVLTGVGVCGGRVEGTARVLPDLGSRREFQRGEILVARQTDPGWAPLFFLASGLVMERGGMLSHGAIVAREFGIPAVIAVPDATRQLVSGERIVVDGDQGRIHRLDEP